MKLPWNVTLWSNASFEKASISTKLLSNEKQLMQILAFGKNFSFKVNSIFGIYKHSPEKRERKEQIYKKQTYNRNLCSYLFFLCSFLFDKLHHIKSYTFCTFLVSKLTYILPGSLVLPRKVCVFPESFPPIINIAWSSPENAWLAI